MNAYVSYRKEEKNNGDKENLEKCVIKLVKT